MRFARITCKTAPFSLFSISFFAVIVNARLQFLLFFAVILPKNVCKKKKNVLKYLQVSSLIGVSPAFLGLTPNFLFFGGIQKLNATNTATPTAKPHGHAKDPRASRFDARRIFRRIEVGRNFFYADRAAYRHARLFVYGGSVAIRGVLQGFGEICTPLIISVLRLIFSTLPLVYLFTLCKNAAAMIWRAFPISEVAAAVSCAFLLRRLRKQTKATQTLSNDAQNHAPGL